MDVLHERSFKNWPRFGVWDEEAEIAEWHRVGPRSSNDAVHDTIVEMIEELKLSGVLKTTGDGWGSSYDGQEIHFVQGEEQEWILIGEGSYDVAPGISLGGAEPLFQDFGAETSDDFEATVDDFEQEFWDRINSGGEDETFCSNQKELMSMIVRGWIRFDGIMCEIESERMIITMTPTSSMVKVYGHPDGYVGLEDDEEYSSSEEETAVADSIAGRVKDRHFWLTLYEEAAKKRRRAKASQDKFEVQAEKRYKKFKATALGQQLLE